MAKNQNYLKDWDDYQASKKKRTPIFLPLSIDIKDGKFVRRRMKAPEVKTFYKSSRAEVPSYMLKNEPVIPNPEIAIKDYLNYFGPIDGVEGPLPESPTTRPLFSSTCRAVTGSSRKGASIASPMTLMIWAAIL